MKSKLEYKIDKDLAELGVRSYVYHIRDYKKGSHRRILGSFAAITIAYPKYVPFSDIERGVCRAIEDLAKERMVHGGEIHPATWIMRELHVLGYHGVAICDNRDDFSRKRGRIIAKGRLLKHLRLPELPDGAYQLL